MSGLLRRDPLYERLVRRARGESRAQTILREIAAQVGLAHLEGDRVLTALALIKTGTVPEEISGELSWLEFEAFCAGLLVASGYVVKRNLVITKPRRQIDIFASNPSLALSVDCKHWAKGLSGSQLEQIAMDQVERTLLYKKKRGLIEPVLPVVFTALDVAGRVALGVPVVPIFMVRDFLNSVNRFEPQLQIV
jgi:Restriction endonuclease